ncbi:MAG: hypothetical protein ACW98F_20645 [Candidatus Hodarchaeales archaeon]|jgi:hypothetical protein
MTEIDIKHGFLEQYGAAFKTLEKIIDLCPENLWMDLSTGPEMYKIIYHILYFADFYLSENKIERESFTPRFSHAEDFGTSKENFHPKEWERPLLKSEIKEYLKEIRIRAQNRLNNLNSETLTESSVFEWHGSSKCGSLIYNLRHMMLHIGALQARLRISGVEGRFWVSQSTILE